MMLRLAVASAGVANSCSTAAAESPVSPNLLMMTSAVAFALSSGARVANTMSNGMSAVKAWDDSTMHLSIPAIATKRATHRPRNDPRALRPSAIRSEDGPMPSPLDSRTGAGHRPGLISEPCTVSAMMMTMSIAIMTSDHSG